MDHSVASQLLVLLLFTIGLEFSLPRLLAAKRLLLGLGGAQVLSTALLFGLVALWLRLSPVEVLILGSALALSSTAIVLKQLGEQMELPAPHGRVVIGILLFQDLAAVPPLVVLPIIAADSGSLTIALMLALAKAVIVFLALVFVGRRLLPSILNWVAATRSLELFMLTALLLAVAAAGLSSMAGLSPTLGAFMAGMLLGETLFCHQIEADIRPFRDLMLGLFFATIGMQLDPKTFIESPAIVMLIVIDLPVLVRSTRGRDEEALIEAGATVFPEGLENSLAFAGQMLIMLGVPHSRVETILNTIRAADYAPLRVFFHDTAEGMALEPRLDYPEQVPSVIVGDNHFGAGRTPEELGLKEPGIELVDVCRGAIRVPGRLLDTRLRSGDVLVLKGDHEALEQAKSCVVEGA